ncbi:MAG TPA: 50S ribosomal protein L23 [Blastocatellia bacterium]|nr:50S ribosomal protein L23 [Blastocatellia bacterium]
MKTIWDVIKAPVVTEKAVSAKDRRADAGEKQLLSFIVAKNANKHSIKRAVETIFNVKVDAVRVLNGSGKQVRRGRLVGYKPDYRKAYVTLKKGERVIDYGDTI